MTTTMTKKITKGQLNQMLGHAIMQAENIGIEVGNTKPQVRLYKATSYLGQCRLRKIDGVKEYEITVSEYHLESEITAVMNTIMHEVLHTVEGCMNHGKKWQGLAGRVNERYGYDISRSSGGEEYEGFRKAKQRNAKYIIGCSDCSATWERARKSKIVTNTSDYLCSCGGRLERIK